MNTVYEVIDDLRKQHYLSVRKLAKLANIAPATLASALSRKPDKIPVKTLKALADVFHVKWNDIANIPDDDLPKFDGVSTIPSAIKQHTEEKPKDVNSPATMKVFKSVHGTVHVVIQNCSAEIVTLLHRFDVWGSNGNYKYDETKPKERAEIWFECPMEFIDFVKSSMGRYALQRMGVKEFHID